MSNLEIQTEQLDLLWLEDTVWIANREIGIAAYDFHFENFFVCRHPLYRENKVTAVGRFGAVEDYVKVYENLLQENIELINSPEQHFMASELTHWYPLLKELTPRSMWFDEPPEAKVVEQHFDYPIFVKGSRQTSRHAAELSIINSRTEYEKCRFLYRQNQILNWQNFVVREFVKLRKVAGDNREKISPSFEFRTFWWKGNLAGAGSYWKDFAKYDWSDGEKKSAIGLAEKAVIKLNLPFVVIDLAQTADGEWIIIECNDAQESGYASISPIGLWQNIVDLEKELILK